MKATAWPTRALLLLRAEHDFSVQKLVGTTNIKDVRIELSDTSPYTHDAETLLAHLIRANAGMPLPKFQHLGLLHITLA